MRILPLSPYSYSTNTKPAFGARIPIPIERHNELRVFLHHIYEYKKGLRSLILTTEKKHNQPYIEGRLDEAKIPYHITKASENSINVFFGNEDCIKVIKSFKENLPNYTPEQDFMLGVMLGYDKILQCKRYMKILGKKLNHS